jgi:hypothetical protein
MKRPPVPAMKNAADVERSMRWLGAYFAVYAAIGFGYPIATGGETLLGTGSRTKKWVGSPNLLFLYRTNPTSTTRFFLQKPSS